MWPVILFTVLFLDAKETLGMRYLLSAKFPFLIIISLWTIARYVGLNVVFFLSCTSLFHLFGWLITLSLFIRSSENACVFLFLLKEIIIEDVLRSFGIVFLFILVGFSSAVHVLRNSALSGNKTYCDTLYNLFASTLTTGEFISETFEDSLGDKSNFLSYQFRATFALYLCCATIIMLNILISTITNRYAEIMKTAKNVWRFHMVKSGMRVIFKCRFSLSRFLRVFRFYEGLPKTLKRIFGTVNPNYDRFFLKEEKDFLFLKCEKCKRIQNLKGMR